MTAATLRRVRTAAALAIAAASYAPATALAAPSPSTAPTTTAPAATSVPTTPKPKPKPKPPPPPAVIATASVRLAGLFTVHRASVTVPNRAVEVNGTVSQFVPGQRLTLRAFVNGRRFESTSLQLKRTGGRAGWFGAIVRAPGAGNVSVVVTHQRNLLMRGFEARAGYQTLDEDVGYGSTGRFVQLIQQRLAALHFYIPQTGVFDAGTELALDAYHRLLRWGYAQTVGPATTTQLLNGAGAFRVRFPGQGEHAEGDLSDQLVALINGSAVRMIFPISSGKPSTPTILGSYRVYLRTPGYLPDGMYYSDFFIGGYALHGYDPAPDYPASHGCMRLPIVDAITAYNWLKLGDWVDTYYT